MILYCLDTSVLIEAKNGPYGFDFAPRFWDWLDHLVGEERLFCTMMVYREIAKGSDELADWVTKRRLSGMFAEVNTDTENVFRSIADDVMANYEEYRASPFLAGADPWVIAHAKASEAVVVSHETRVDNASHKVKIPNVCSSVGVECVDVYRMLRDTGAVL